jgi:integrase
MKGHIRERSPGRWAIVIDLKTGAGRRRKWHSFKGTKRQAQDECTRLLRELQTGNYVEPMKLTVGQLLQDRMTQWIGSGRISPKTGERYRELIDGQINPHIGGKLVQRLRVADIEAWHNTLCTSGLKGRSGGVAKLTVRTAHGILAAALRDAVRHGLVPNNVASLQSPPKADGEEVAIITEDQIAELLGKLKGRAIYPEVVVALFTGLRRGELLALKWGHVDLEAKTLHVREALQETAAGVSTKQPKTRAGRRDIVLPDVVVDTLREHRKSQLEQRVRLGLGKLSDRDSLFATIDGRLPSPKAFSTRWAYAAAAIGMPGISFHALRHTHASMLIASGLDVVSVAKRLGHANPTVTLRVYSHLFRVADTKAAEIINAAMAKLLPNG